MIRNCDFCGREYKADSRNLKRGWGLCCSKSCAAKKREGRRQPKDVAITLLQTLANATGAEFENEALAVEIITETLSRA